MKTIINKLRKAVNVVLHAPVKLPTKIKKGARYVAWLLGIVDCIVDNPAPRKEHEEGEEVPDE